MATVFKPARSFNQLNHDIKTKVTDYLPNKEKYTFVDLFPELVDQITVFDSLVDLDGGIAAKVNLFHNLPNVKTVILPDPRFEGLPEGFSKIMKAIFSGSNPNITSFLDPSGSLLMGCSDTRPMANYIANVRKRNHDYDGSDVKNMFTDIDAYELVWRDPVVKIKLYVRSFGLREDWMELLADEKIRSKIVCLRTSLDCQFPDHWTFESVTSLILPWWQEHASLFLEQFPNITRLCLTLVEFPLDPVTDFISSLESLKHLELEFETMRNSSKPLVKFMLNPPRNPNLESFTVQCLFDDIQYDSSWIVPSLQLDIRPGFKLLKLIGRQGRFVMKNKKIVIENLEPRLIDIFNKFSHIKYIIIINGDMATEEYQRQAQADLEVIRSNLPRRRAVTLKFE